MRTWTVAARRAPGGGGSGPRSRRGLLLLLVLWAAGAGCAPDRGATEAASAGAARRETYDFVARIESASVRLGERGPPRPGSRLDRHQPWSTDERLSIAVRPDETLEFDDVPLRPGGVLSVACGLLAPAPGEDSGASEGAAPVAPVAAARFLVDLEWGGQRVRLLDESARGTSTDTVAWRVRRLALPGAATASAGTGRVTFRVEGAPAAGPARPVWCGPKLAWERGGPRGSVASRRVRRALLDVRCLQAGPDDGASRRVELAADGVRFAPDGAGPFLHQVPPARASWRLQLEPGSLLSFSLIGLAPPGASSRRFAFDLAVDGRELFSQEVVLGVPRTPARHVVDLLDGAAPASGLRRLDLSVRALDGDPEAARDAEALWVRPMLERRTLVPRQRAGEGPNVLLVVVDTLRADHLASYGYGRVTTPSLDARAERGVVFEQAMSQSSWTVPSVATLLTGQYAYTHGLYDAAHWRLLPTVPTLADAFAAAGVSTVCVVANPLLTEANQSTRGFEDVVTVPHARAAQVNRGFLDWLDAHDDERFFAYVHYQEPHEPYAAPGDGLTAFGRPRPDAPHGPTLSADLSRKVRHALGRAAANGGTPEPGGALLVQELIDLYDGEILSWDEQFDALLQDLDRRGVLQDTLVVVTSDHGEEFGEHGLLGHGRSLHDELLHVPLVMLNTPLPPGRRDDLVGLIDLAPTLVRLAGLPAAATQGFAFVGEDLAGGPVGRASLFAQTSHGQRGFDEPQIGMQALIARDLKAIAFEDDDGLLLYDRRDDPLEQQPLAGPAAAELAESCRRLLEEWERRCRDGGAARGGLVDAGAIEALRAMGYVR